MLLVHITGELSFKDTTDQERAVLGLVGIDHSLELTFEC